MKSIYIHSILNKSNVNHKFHYPKIFFSSFAARISNLRIQPFLAIIKVKTGSTKILTKINHEEEEEDRLQDLSNSISHLVLPRVSWYGKVDAREVDGVVHPRMHQRARVPREGGRGA